MKWEIGELFLLAIYSRFYDFGIFFKDVSFVLVGRQDQIEQLASRGGRRIL